MFQCGPGKKYQTGAVPGDSGAPFVKRHKALGLLSHRNGNGSGNCVLSFSGAREAENLLKVRIQGE